MFPRPRHILFQLTFTLALGLTACGSLSGTPATETSAPPTQTSIPPTATPPPLAATVNGEWILEEEFLSEVDRYRAAQDALGNEVNSDEAVVVVLDDLIAQVLLAQAARADGFEMTEADLGSRMEALGLRCGRSGCAGKLEV